MSWFEKLPSIISTIGGSALFVTSIGWIIGRFTERQNLKWQKEQKKEIEQLRSEIMRNQAVLNTAITTFSNGHQYAQERILKAVDAMWEAMIDLRNYSGKAFLFYDILIPKEYNQAFKNPKVGAIISYLSHDKLANAIESASAKTELNRPYLGEHLWRLFYIYRAFIGRICALLIIGKENGQFDLWQNDLTLENIVSSVLKEDDIEAAKEMPIGGPRYLLDLLEVEILIELSTLISGEKSGEVGLSQAKKFLRAIQETEKNIKKSNFFNK